MPAALAQMRRVLRPGGVLALVTAMGDVEGYEEVEYAAGRQHWYVYHRAPALRQLLVETGFRVLAEQERTSNRHWLQMLARAQ